MKISILMTFLSILLIKINTKKCNRKLMRDYGLGGHYLAKKEFNPFC